jgi:hypothetical protein
VDNLPCVHNDANFGLAGPGNRSTGT